MTDRAAGAARRRAPWVSAALAVLLASCGHKELPQAPPPPLPPPVVVIPPRPTPPDGAAPNMVTPEIEADGNRESVNRKISVNQVVWNLRSAYTVAALDCLNPRNVAILPHYRSFLARNAGVLKSVYDQMDHDFREKYGRGGESLRDNYLTVLYNHYALPPTKEAFCDVVDQVLADGVDVPPADLGEYAQTKVPLIEKVFDDFYDRYDQYRNALAEWEAKYGHTGQVHIEPLSDTPDPAPPRPVMQPAPQYTPQPVPQPAPQYGPQPAPQPAPQYGPQPVPQPAPQYTPPPIPEPTPAPARLPQLPLPETDSPLYGPAVPPPPVTSGTP